MDAASFRGHDAVGEHVEALEKIGCPLANRYGSRLAIHLLLCGDPPVPVHENWAVNVVMDREHYAHDKYGVAMRRAST